MDNNESNAELRDGVSSGTESTETPAPETESTGLGTDMSETPVCDTPRDKTVRVSKIGGQAVIEGVMMRGASASAMCVRAESGEKLLMSERLKPAGKAGKIPVLRGVINFVAMMVAGIKVLMKSAEVFGTEDEEEMPKSALYFSVFLGIALSVALFIFLPSLLSDAFFGWIHVTESDGLFTLYKALFEGLLRILIFIGYLLLTSLMKDIRRTYMYHGAEHKTINAYEHGLELTVENVAASSKVHNRCGTTFMFIVLTISILFFALANWLVVGVFGWESKWWINLLVRLVLLPIVAGVSYEVLKGLAYLPDNWFSKALRAPGLSLQAITTKEPTPDMIECAIAAFNEVLALDEDPERGTVSYDYMDYTDARARVEKVLTEANAEACELDWIWCDVLGKSRAELREVKEVKRTEFNRAMSYAKRRLDGTPLAYALGNAYFYGDKLKVTPAVLIPRPETELVAEQAVIRLLERENATALDLCTGSGCIAYTLAKYGKARVLATDVSSAAIRVAKRNCAGLDVEFAVGDMFASVSGEFDLIVSNPPYIPTCDLASLQREVRKEPVGALDGGDDGLVFYREIADKCGAYLKDGGVVVLELGVNQADAVRALFDGWQVEVLPDYGGIDRILIATKSE